MINKNTIFIILFNYILFYLLNVVLIKKKDLNVHIFYILDIINAIII